MTLRNKELTLLVIACLVFLVCITLGRYMG